MQFITPLFINYLYGEYEEESKKIAKQSQSFVDYFAYGSTMNQQFFEDKIGPVTLIGQASLKGFQLNFAKAFPSCSARATLIPHASSCVEGAIYRINRLQLSQLDSNKGNCYTTQRVRLYVRTNPLCPPFPIELHLLHFEKGMIYHPPSQAYLNRMLQGAETIKVTEKYFNHIFHRATLFNQPASKL